MKKRFLLFVFMVSALAITGCGKNNTKTLYCTSREETDGVVTSSVMDISFKNSEAEKITLDISIDYTDKYKDYVDTFKETLETQKTELEKIGYNVDITLNSSSLSLKAVGTNKTLDKSEYQGTYAATKKSSEDSGYTCK